MNSIIFFEEPLKWLGCIAITFGACFLLAMYVDWLYRIFTRPKKENRMPTDPNGLGGTLEDLQDFVEHNESFVTETTPTSKHVQIAESVEDTEDL